MSSTFTTLHFVLKHRISLFFLTGVTVSSTAYGYHFLVENVGHSDTAKTDPLLGADCIIPIEEDWCEQGTPLGLHPRIWPCVCPDPIQGP